MNEGQIESVNLVEWLSVDQLNLFRAILKQIDRLDYLQLADSKIALINKQTVNMICRTIGEVLLKIKREEYKCWTMFRNHASDTVRNLCCYSIGLDENLSVKEMLVEIAQFAKDKHFGVRETSWMAARAKIEKNLEESIQILEEWAANEKGDPSKYVRDSVGN